MNVRRPDVALALLLLALVLLAYAPALAGGFVIDDRINVTPVDLRPLSGLGRIWTELGATQQYYPILYTVFWLEHRLWGDAVLGYHLVNLFEHVAVALLLVALMRRLALPGAWLAAFAFALHPVAVESVAWIAEQKNTLSTLFVVASAWVYLRFETERRSSDYALASGLFVLALLTKSVTATLPAALLVLVAWRRGRLGWRRDVAPLVPWLGAGLAMGLFSAWVERHYVGATGDAFAVSFFGRVAIACRAVWFYAGKLVWPAEVQFIYPRWDPALYSLPGIASMLGMGLIAVGLGFLWRRSRGAVVATLLFVGLLFPTLGFLNVYWFVLSWVADHFVYLPSVPIIAAVSAGIVGWAMTRSAFAVRAVYAVGVLVVAVLAVATWHSAGRFRDHETLCRATLAQNPKAWMMHHNLAVELGERGRLAEAIAEFRATIRIRPAFADAHLNLAQALVRTPESVPEALAEFAEAVRLAPTDSDAQYAYANALANAGRLEEAIQHYRAAVALRPRWADAYFYLANALAETRRPAAEVKAALQAALTADPRHPGAQQMWQEFSASR